MAKLTPPRYAITTRCPRCRGVGREEDVRSWDGIPPIYLLLAGEMVPCPACAGSGQITVRAETWYTERGC